jgi:hypothetical protein
VPNQYFGAVDERSDDFEGNPNDGVMGTLFSVQGPMHVQRLDELTVMTVVTWLKNRYGLLEHRVQWQKDLFRKPH